mmetsp:Transcript_32910/g.65574  ORF Transcript_32910/g.65574 Transcript_32910/m.65574 type:complete len:369 (+) Transcript_32910:105-1211(+)
MATERVLIKDLDDLVLRAMRNLGYPEDEAQVLTEVMMHAEIHNNNQGISKLYDVNAPGGLKYNHDAGPLLVERESAVGAVVNGNQRSGMSALSKAVDLAVVKATAKGGPRVAVVGTYNTCTSTGMLAYYAAKLGEAGLVGIVLAQSPELVAPSGGSKPVFGTNPICVAVPGPEDGPLVLDMATAAMTLFGLITAKANSQPLPAGCAIGSNGEPTTDPDEALKGALLTFGGHKGSGLSLIVELLGGVLPGAAFPGDEAMTVFPQMGKRTKKQAKNWGNTVIAFDPEILMDRGEFARRVRVTLGAVKASGPSVRLPGETEKMHRAANEASGALNVSVALLGKIREIASATAPPAAAGIGTQAHSLQRSRL